LGLVAVKDLLFSGDGNFALPCLTRPSPALPLVGFPHPAKVMGREWGKILAPHHRAGR